MMPSGWTVATERLASLIEAQKAHNSRQDCHECEILRRQLSRFSAFIGMDESFKRGLHATSNAREQVRTFQIEKGFIPGPGSRPSYRGEPKLNALSKLAA